MTPLSSSDFLKRAEYIASYYGFEPLATLRPATNPKHKVEIPEALTKDPLGMLAASVAKRCVTCENPSTKHFFLYHTEPAQQLGKVKSGTLFSLSAVGSPKSISESLIIKTALAILEDIGIPKATVHINSIGDRDSNARFVRELTSTLRKTIDKLSPPCQQALKRDPFEALQILLSEENSLKEQLPRPLHFLSEGSRRHLREVIEFLEYNGIPYVIEDYLIGNRDLYSQTLFEIRGTIGNVPHTLVRGGRLDELSRRNFRINLPLVSALFSLKGKSAVKPSPRSKAPKFFIVQLGFSAKLLALSLIERLRKAHVPIRGSLEHDSLKDQLDKARLSGASYLIIMGQREVIDKTAIIRNMESQAQMIVPVDTLPLHLKKSLSI